jgi:hypothetical protein
MLNQEIVRDIATLSLSLFGIGITLLTVLISFAISKKDTVKAYSDARKISTMDVSLKGKIAYSIEYIRYIRKAIIHISMISAMSLFSYLLWWFNIFVNTCWISYVTISITLGAVAYIIALTTLVMRFFWKYTKI